jgi:translation initiation factor 4G
MMVDIRPASEADVPLLAWVQQEAARSHLPVGFWDLAFPGPDADRLRVIERIARARARSFCHWSGFLVAELDGEPAAALSGYARPSIAAGSALEDALQQALDEEGWTERERAAMGSRIAPFLTCIPDTPEDAWVVEWVATRPEHRGKGLIKGLLEAIIARGRSRGHALVQIGVLIGNRPAQHAYESVGFRVVEEKRHPDFEAALGSPGIRRMVL